MFTGLVTAIGTVRRASRTAEGLTLKIAAAYRRLARGESIAVDGACLTVESRGAGWFTVHVVRTSLERTRFAGYQAGQKVNLERALRVGDRLGGHLVQGHVDGVGKVAKAGRRGDAVILDLAVPPAVVAASIPLGSITVDGVSLTVNAKPSAGIIQIALIPFTLEHTTLGLRHPGDEVHVEADTIGKYVAAFISSAGAEWPATR
ncbi:MAG: riboflavin synthase [Gemmatimonadales bacterium]